MAELSQLDGATSCSVCDQSRARGRSAEGPRRGERRVFSVTQALFPMSSYLPESTGNNGKPWPPKKT